MSFSICSSYDHRKTVIYQITQETSRTTYFLSYLTEALKGMCDDGIPFKGVLSEALTDNFEWNSGYIDRYGVQYVDYNSPTLARTFKRSAMEMSQFWQAHRCVDGSN